MITKVTKENKVLYKALFEKATKDLFGEDPQFVVDSLDKYFSRLTTLSEKDPIYTVLPLDEPTFDIDTNTRIITVPADFSKNGVSVQGDEVSEVIYFTVDRYVDTMDLFREDIKIAIQWETAPDSKNQTLKGISPEYLRDITTYAQQGKMLFGWALRSDITKNPGTIKFSVRFYHRNTEGQLDFSLNTLTASAVIKPSLDYKFENGEFEYDIIDSTNLIKGRLEDSVFNDKTPGKDASEPTFQQDIPLASDIQGNPVVDPDERVFLIIDLKSEEPKEGEQEVLYYDFQA